MKDTTAQAGWYPDPAGSAGLRYFDGTTWTGHLSMPLGGSPGGYGYPPVYRPPWKGAQYGRPAEGPGALANPGKRLGAFALDWLILLPVFLIITTVAILIVAPHAGPIFPKTTNDVNQPAPFPGFFWIYFTFLGSIVVSQLAWFAYVVVAIARYGHTLGQKWLHIRPVRLDGRPLGWGLALGRTALMFLASCLGWIGLLDYLWCCWDDNRQCLHDKVVDALVVNDGAPISAASTVTTTFQ